MESEASTDKFSNRFKNKNIELFYEGEIVNLNMLKGLYLGSILSLVEDSFSDKLFLYNYYNNIFHMNNDIVILLGSSRIKEIITQTIQEGLLSSSQYRSYILDLYRDIKEIYSIVMSKYYWLKDEELCNKLKQLAKQYNCLIFSNDDILK